MELSGILTVQALCVFSCDIRNASKNWMVGHSNLCFDEIGYILNANFSFLALGDAVRFHTPFLSPTKGELFNYPLHGVSIFYLALVPDFL